MKKYNYKTYIALLFFFLCVTLITVLFLTKMKLEKINNMYSELHFSDSIQIHNMVEKNLLLSENTTFILPPETILKTEGNECIELSEIGIQDKTLVIRFNEFSCLDCIFDTLEDVYVEFKDSSKQSIILLASYNNNRYLFLNKRLNNITLPVYNIPPKSLLNTIDRKDIPYIFVLHKNYKATNLFIPSKGGKMELRKYLNGINLNESKINGQRSYQ